MAGMLPGIAFLLLGIHYLSEAKRSNGASKRGVSGAGAAAKPASTFSQAFARGGHPLPTAVEQNEYTKLSPTLQRPAKGKLEQVRSLEGRIKRINGQIKLGSTDPAVRKLALEIVAARKPDGSYAVAEKDWEGEARAIFGWVRANMRYTRDSAFADTYVNPARTLFDKKPHVAAAGDCDDYCITMGSLLASIGHSPTLRVVAAKSGAGDKPGWNHIYLKNCLPAGGAIAGAGGKCVPMDASIDKPYGWEVPRNRIHKMKDFPVR